MWGKVLSGLASGAGGSLLAGLNPAPSAPVLPWQGQAASNLYGGIGSLNNPYSAMQPLEYQQLLAMLKNPNTKGMMTGANQAAGAYGRAGVQAGQGADMLMRDANSIYGEAFDPQNALRNQLQQRTQDQSNVTNAMYGLSGSGAGAGIADQNLTNFNIDWQNQQLQRMLSGNQAIGQDVSGAQQLRQAGANDYLMKGRVPYDAYKGAVGDVNNAIGTYMGGAQQGNDFTQQGITDWLNYLGFNSNAAGVNQNAYDQNQNTASMYGAALYPAMQQGFSSLGNMFSNWGGSDTTTQPSVYDGSGWGHT